MTTPRPFPTTEHAVRSMDRALERVDAATDVQWRAAALDAVRRTAQALPEFISDDVWTVGGLAQTREDRALGPIMQRAKREGWAVKTDRVKPSVRSHMSGKPVWRSLIYNTNLDAPAPAHPADDSGQLRIA